MSLLAALKRPQNNTKAIGFSAALLGALLMSLDPIFIRYANVSGFDTAFLFGLFSAISMPILLKMNDKRGIRKAAVAAIFSWLILKEKTNRSTIAAIAVVMIGIGIVVSGSYGSGNWIGDAMAIFSVICVSLMFTLLRKYKEVSRMASVGLGSLMLATVMFFFAEPTSYTTNTWIYMACMGLASAPIGRLMTLVATRYITAAEVSMTLMLNTVLAPVWGGVIFAEIPASTSLVGGAIIFITLLIYTYTSMKNAQ
ncbi:DMT family transporter [Vibrio mexicanus]|uniref:DMT family transporter n=1 Tax=Vibrio mexicanus TaxID=1004326 RepID=UPI00063CE8C8|nr:DMT family transporter [Vibrio mexicanus]